MDRELSMEFVRVTEAAAVACGRLIGKGDKNGADGLAVDAMRQMFDTVHISGTVVIGEGEMDEAPMLYIGEKVGAGGPEVDIAVDPVEGTNLTAKGQNGAIAVMAIAPRGCLLHAPDMYMDKIAVGPRAKGCIDIDAPVKENLCPNSRLGNIICNSRTYLLRLHNTNLRVNVGRSELFQGNILWQELFATLIEQCLDLVIKCLRVVIDAIVGRNAYLVCITEIGRASCRERV